MYGEKILNSDGHWRDSYEINPIGIDAGGRARVSQLTTLGDLKTLNADDTDLLETVGTGKGILS